MPTMIPDTSATDRVIVPTGNPNRRRLWIVVACALLGVLLIVKLAFGWMSSESSVSDTRLRIAEVTRGTLIRDAAVNGRVVAAVSPTLYAPAASTVTLKINAGDKVKKGDLLAVLDSPDLSNQ